MIAPGQTLVNEITGETITFIETAAETGGAYTLIEVVLAPGGGVPMAHVHPNQSETFEVVDGQLAMKAGRDRLLARPGDVVTVAPGQVHKFWNDRAYPVTFRCTVAPALGFERFMETMFALAADGKTNRKGMPNPFRLAVIANAHFDTVRLPFPPALVQRIGLALGAPLGRALGYEPVYVPAEPAPVAVAASL